MQGYRGVRDENGIMRAVRNYPTEVLDVGESNIEQMFIVTNSNMWEDDRFIFGMTHKSIDGLVKEYSTLGDVRVILLAIVPISSADLRLRLRQYCVPRGGRNQGVTDHAVLPLRNMSKALSVNVPGFPNVKPILELVDEEAGSALRMFLRLYRGSRMGNRIYTQLHRHLRLLDNFMSYEMFGKCMRAMGYELNDQGSYEMPVTVGSTRIEFAEKPEVRSFVKGSILDSHGESEDG